MIRPYEQDQGSMIGQTVNDRNALYAPKRENRAPIKEGGDLDVSRLGRVRGAADDFGTI